MAINWDYWLKRRAIHEIEISLLTLGLDPESYPINSLAGEQWVDERDLNENKKEFDMRRNLILDYRFKPYKYMKDDGEWGDYFADGYNNKILVKRFLRWLKNEDFGWDLPKELQAYIEKLDMPNQEHWAQGLVDNLNNKHSQSEPTKVKLSWSLKPLSEIQRMNGYRAVLYQTIQKMYNEGKLVPPTPHEVLNSWRVEFKDQPNDCKIYVLSKSFEYFNEMGTKKIVDIKSLKDAIQRLIITE